MLFLSATVPYTRHLPYNIGRKLCRFHRLFDQSTRFISATPTCSSPLPNGPGLNEFIQASLMKKPLSVQYQLPESHPFVEASALDGHNRKVYIDVYGCQMNVNDTEIVWSILNSSGYSKAKTARDADVVLLMTCAIRDNAEKKIWNRINELRALKTSKSRGSKTSKFTIGILGCMAERLKEKLLEKEKCIDLVAGPDSYRDLPRLLALTEDNQTAVNVLLSLDETYADVVPVRLDPSSVTAFVSIMRGCDNMCTYCIVPFTRGRERSRPLKSIVEEVRQLSDLGIKEVTLLGQNVNSYRDMSDCGEKTEVTRYSEGFKSVYKPKKGGTRFAELLECVAAVDPQIRIRFTSPHPKDFPDEVLEVIQSRPNVCCNIHLPAQSGNSEVLERMRRGYTREAYLKLVDHIRERIPGITLSSDFICGFPGETDEQFRDTITLMDSVRYHVAYLFAYSMREKTAAHRRYKDDIPKEVKQERLLEMNSTFRKTAEELNKEFVGSNQTVLIEKKSKRSDDFWAGRNDGNIKVIIPDVLTPAQKDTSLLRKITPGDYVNVEILKSSSQVLIGKPIHHTILGI